MADKVTDVWFRSGLKLREIAARLGLQGVTYDVENYWEWVIGTLGQVQLDITRTHTRPADQVDTRIFLLDKPAFDEALIAELVGRLKQFVSGPIVCGRWEYRSGNDFDVVVVREF